jgi:hypothetical protein
MGRGLQWGQEQGCGRLCGLGGRARRLEGNPVISVRMLQQPGPEPACERGPAACRGGFGQRHLNFGCFKPMI